MKFNKYIGWSLGMMALFSGCADNDFSDPYRPWDGEVPDELSFIMNVADPDLVRVGETRADDGTIGSLTVMQYDKDGHFIDKLTPDVVKENGKFKINLKLDKDVSTLQFAANCMVSSGCEDLSTEVVSASLPKNDTELAAWYPVLWGSVALSDIMTSANRYEPEIVLYRNVAKVSVSNSADNFTFKGFSVYYTADKGTVAPTIANYNASKPTEASGVSYSSAVENLATNGVAYMYETAKESSSNTPKVIIEGELDGKTYYYVAGFRNREGSGPSDNPEAGKYAYTPLDILRNHHYAFEITSVRGEGWPTAEAAKNAQPDNRLTVWVSDINEEINNMVSSRDYMLGVKDKVTVDYNNPAEITVVCSYPNVESDLIKISLADVSADWIKVEDVNVKTESTSTDPASNKTVRKIVYTIPLEPNDKQTSERDGKIVVRVGDLSRVITITQEGRSLRRERGAFIYGLTGLPDGTDYYNWVDNTCKGLKPEDNRGLERNNALIFAAVPAYGTDGIWYKIPKNFKNEEGTDKSATLDNTSDFSIDGETDTNNWIVKAKNNSNPKLASAKLTITASNGAVIDYELLQVGYFHQLAESYKKYTQGNNFVAGWYYYEVTKVNGYFVLDRNIGSSTNNSFDPTSINYSEEDEKAKGCYFVVNPTRAKFNTDDNSLRYQDLETVTKSLGMDYGTKGRFNIPSEKEFTEMGFVQSQNRGAGSVYIQVDSDSKVSDNKIYVPAAGYYYGNIAKNPTHVNVWTRTLLAGSQGLMESDAEYGYQYRYLNVVGGVVSYQNLRTSAGANGSLNESLRNYLPLRLAWSVTGSVVNPPAPVENYTYRICGLDEKWKDGIALTESNGKWSKKITFSNESSFGIGCFIDGVQKAWIWKEGSTKNVELDKAMNCAFEGEGSGANWTGLKAGTYTFTFDPSAMTLTVIKEGEEPTPSNISYILAGDIFTGSWTENIELNSGNSYSYTGDVQKGKFLVLKIEGDSKTYLKGGNVTLDQWIQLNTSNGDCVLNESGNYTITFDPSNNKLKVVKNGGGNTLEDGHYLAYGNGDSWDSTWATEKLAYNPSKPEYSITGWNATAGINIVFLKVENGRITVINSDSDKVKEVVRKTDYTTTTNAQNKAWKIVSGGSYDFYYKPNDSKVWMQ